MNTQDYNAAVGCAIWIVIIVAIGLAAMIVSSTGCCASTSTCENMLAECERGNVELDQALDQALDQKRACDDAGVHSAD